MTNFLAVVWDVNPVLIHLGPLEVRYYGLFWAFAIGIGMWFFMSAIKREGYPDKIFDPLFWYGVLSTILGARIGHCLFYDFDHYIMNPIEILYVWQGGLASHGAAIGLLIGLALFSLHKKMPYIWSLDRIMVPVALGGAAVRIGNLFNSEIYGVPTDRPWGFSFIQNMGEWMGGAEPVFGPPSHPTQIYEALCYVAVFAVLIYLYYRKDAGCRYPGLMFGVGLVGIFLSRFLIEYVKNPQEAFEENMSLLMGQWLSIPFILLGVVVTAYSLYKKRGAFYAKNLKPCKK